MNRHRLAVIPGDGIGPEVTDAVMPALSAAQQRFGFGLDITTYDYGAATYLATGDLWSDEKAAELRRHDAILFGAMGDPSVPPGVLERGFILAMRTAFRQAVNLRPVYLYPGVVSPLRGLTSETCDMLIVRENTEGLYAAGGSTVHRGTTDAVATQESVNTDAAIRRTARFAFELAQLRRGRLTLCHKTNILVHAGSLWADVVDDLAREFTDVTVDYMHVDAMCYHMVTAPQQFDVVVTDNLFGDIITDLGAAIQGGLGLSASANLNLTGDAPSMFEPIHGSAPTIAGLGSANPCGALLSAALCLARLGEVDAAVALEHATAAAMASDAEAQRADRALTTREIGDTVAESVAAAPEPGDNAVTTVSRQLARWSQT